MDKDSLTLIVNGFDKPKFDKTVKIVVNEILGMDAVNVDQLIIKKGYPCTLHYMSAYYIVMDNNFQIDRDSLKKKIRKYKIQHLFFVFKYNITEGDLTKKNLLLKVEYGVDVTCFCTRTLSDLIIGSGKERVLFENNSREFESTDYDYLAAAFHSMTIASPEAIKLKGQVYDDAILFKISTNTYTH